jgi:hypothetical protein
MKTKTLYHAWERWQSVYLACQALDRWLCGGGHRRDYARLREEVLSHSHNAPAGGAYSRARSLIALVPPDRRATARRQCKSLDYATILSAIRSERIVHMRPCATDYCRNLAEDEEDYCEECQQRIELYRLIDLATDALYARGWKICGASEKSEAVYFFSPKYLTGIRVAAHRSRYPQSAENAQVALDDYPADDEVVKRVEEAIAQCELDPDYEQYGS